MAKPSRSTNHHQREIPKSAPTETVWERFHQAYVAEPIPEPSGLAPGIAKLARRLGLPRAEADRRATRGRWWLERQARACWSWQRSCGFSAKTENEFILEFTARHYTHLLAEGEEGRALTIAVARDVWRRAMGKALEWEAAKALKAAQEAYDKAQERKRQAAKVCEHCPRRKAAQQPPASDGQSRP